MLGSKDEKTAAVYERIQRAIEELGLTDVEVEQIEDQDRIAAFNIAPSQTPAVVMARYQVKSMRSVPEVIVIKEWLKDF